MTPTSSPRWSNEDVEECSRLWKLTNEQKKKLQQLGDRISDVDHWKNDPFEVVRFLHEFKFDLKTAEQKFRASVKWRLQHNADSIIEDYGPPKLFNYFPIAVLEGADREGDPIYIERTGAADSLGLLHRFGKDEMIQQAIWGHEMVMRGPWLDSWPHGQRGVQLMTTILDMKGLNRNHLNPSLIPVGQAVTRLTQDNYPGFTKKILVIRAPFFFRVVWNVFKHFVDPHVREQLEIATEKETRDLLERFMDLSVLPKEIVPEGKGRAAPGFNPVWEGGPLPPPSKNDRDRVTPLGKNPEERPQSSGPSSASDPTGSSPETPRKEESSTTNSSTTSSSTLTEEKDTSSWVTLPSKRELLQTPLQPTASDDTVDTGNSWESLPAGTPPRNVQQAWTVTPTPIQDWQHTWSLSALDAVTQLWNLNGTDQDQLLQLRDALRDVHHAKNNPFDVVRFLQDNLGNVPRAEQQFRRMIIWRVEKEMDDFFNKYGQPNPLFHRMPICVMKGLDKDGDPIYVDRIGACDYPSLYRHFGPDRMVDYILFLRELNSCPRFWQPYQERVGHVVKNYTVIIDLEGLNAGHMRPTLLKLLQRTARLSQNYYAGWAKRILVIRAPPIFKLVWPVVKKYFAPQVHSMIEIAHGNEHMALLDQYMDRRVLPSSICPEGQGEPMPGYYENVDMEGGPIPPEVFQETNNIQPQPAPIFSPMSSPPAMVHKGRSSPVATTSLILGHWEDGKTPETPKPGAPIESTSIRAYSTPPKPAFQSPMFKYHW